MILHIYPIANTESVVCVDDYGHYTKTRDIVFGTFDLMRTIYDDVILHNEPIE